MVMSITLCIVLLSLAFLGSTANICMTNASLASIVENLSQYESNIIMENILSTNAT